VIRQTSVSHTKFKPSPMPEIILPRNEQRANNVSSDDVVNEMGLN
jgi:hypothetical protein